MFHYKRFLSKNAPRFLQAYKPIDEKLRCNALYAKLSSGVHSVYHQAVEPFLGADDFYVKNFDAFPVEEDLILFESYWGRKIGCNPYALYREMIGDPRLNSFKIIWVKNAGVDVPSDVASNDKVTYVEYQSVDYAKALLKSKYLVSNSTFPAYFVRKPAQEYINLWHGIPVKHMGLHSDPAIAAAANTQRNFLQATKILLSSEYAIERTVVPYGADALSKPKAEVVGSPRLDLTLNTSRGEVRDLLGIKDGKKIMLYAPTWRGRVSRVSSDVKEQLAAIEEIQTAYGDDYHILLSIHNYTRSKMKSMPEGVKLVPDSIDINILLAGVDLLISDYSSIFVDYLVLDRPLILYVPDRVEYEKERGLYLSLDEMPAALATSLDSLNQAIAESKPPSMFDTYNRIMELLLPLEDGRSSQRTLEQIWFKSKHPRGMVAQKKKIFIHPGTFIPNGITTSFLNLVSNIDYEQYEVFVMVDTRTIGKDPARRRCFESLDPRCQLVLRRPQFLLSPTEKAIYESFGDGAELGAEALQTLKLAFAREAKRIVGDSQFDVAIDFSGYSQFWSLIVSSISAGRHIIYQHNDLYLEANNASEHRTKYNRQLQQVFNCYQFFDEMVSVSHEVGMENRRNLKSFYPPNAKLSIVRNSLNLDAIKRKAADPLAFICPKFALVREEKGLIKFVTVGRLSPEKNQSRLLKAFALALDKGLNAVLFIVGDGPLKKTLQAESRKLKIDGRVVFTGWVANPYPLVAAADALILSSDYEGQPMTLLEALAIGTPCIGTNIPGIKSVLDNGVGVLSDQNEASLANAMSKFASTPSLRAVKFDGDAYVATVMKDFYKCIDATNGAPDMDPAKEVREKSEVRIEGEVALAI